MSNNDKPNFNNAFAKKDYLADFRRKKEEALMQRDVPSSIASTAATMTFPSQA